MNIDDLYDEFILENPGKIYIGVYDILKEDDIKAMKIILEDLYKHFEQVYSKSSESLIKRLTFTFFQLQYTSNGATDAAEFNTTKERFLLLEQQASSSQSKNISVIIMPQSKNRNKGIN